MDNDVSERHQITKNNFGKTKQLLVALTASLKAKYSLMGDCTCSEKQTKMFSALSFPKVTSSESKLLFEEKTTETATYFEGPVEADISARQYVPLGIRSRTKRLFSGSISPIQRAENQLRDISEEGDADDEVFFCTQTGKEQHARKSFSSTGPRNHGPNSSRKQNGAEAHHTKASSKKDEQPASETYGSPFIQKSSILRSMLEGLSGPHSVQATSQTPVQAIPFSKRCKKMSDVLKKLYCAE